MEERESTGRATRKSIEAMTKYYPALIDALNAKVGPTAMAQLEADRAVSPGYAQLTADIYKQQAPEMARVAAGAQDITDKAASARELDLARTTGRELVSEADAAQRVLDPEFYKTRENLGGAMEKYLKASDPTLNETELEAMRRGIGRTSFNPGSAMDTAVNAMNFGQMGRDKVNSYGAAIGQVAQSIPAMRSGISGFEVATRRNIGANTGENRIGTAKEGTGQQAYTSGNNFMNGIFGLKQQEMSQQKSLLDNVSGWTQVGGQMIGAVGKGLMCWVAREVYGEDNPKWLFFRHWLYSEAPAWFFNLYMNFGRAFAGFISDKPFIKSIIRRWMDSKI